MCNKTIETVLGVCAGLCKAISFNFSLRVLLYNFIVLPSLFFHSVVAEYTVLTQIQWVNWMDGMPEYVIDPNMRFSDIIVPTTDTVRAHFLLELLISNFKQV